MHSLLLYLPHLTASAFSYLCSVSISTLRIYYSLTSTSPFFRLCVHTPGAVNRPRDQAKGHASSRHGGSPLIGGPRRTKGTSAQPSRKRREHARGPLKRRAVNADGLVFTLRSIRDRLASRAGLAVLLRLRIGAHVIARDALAVSRAALPSGARQRGETVARHRRSRCLLVSAAQATDS